MDQRPNNLLDVYELYIKHLRMAYPDKQAANFIRELGYTFTSCLLVGLGYSHIPSGKKLTQVEIQAARDFMRTQEVKTLLDARAAQQEGFKLVDRSQKMRDIYLRSLEKFLVWCGQQPWWPGECSFLYSPNSEELCCPDLQGSHGAKARKKLTHRRNIYIAYRLKPKEISTSLQTELNEFYKFLTAPEYPQRINKPIKASCANQYLSNILLFLGWFYHFEKIPLEQLTFNLLIPRISKEDLKGLTEKEQNKRWTQCRKQVETWINNYLSFLRESMHAISPRTKGSKLSSLAALGKFQYRTEAEVNHDYKQNLILQVIENQHQNNSQKVTRWNRNKRFVADQEQKWPTVKEGQTALSAVQQDILEPLRLECLPKNKNNQRREGSAITQSLQRFLAWFFLAGIPARRQEEYRDLKLALSCPVERPSGLPDNGVYHPLPPADVREQRFNGTVADNYIYKTYFYQGKFYSHGLWVLDIQEYKMADKYGPQSIVIKNRQFEDGTHLYDYFEQYLYGWWLPGGRKQQQLYDWWQQDLKGRRGRWVSLGRASFEPGDMCCANTKTQKHFWSWGYFFVQPKIGKRFTASRFEEFVETSAHHCTGKQISPHILRSVWATWAYQMELTGQQKSSLAYAMGHDLRTLKDLYERSSPEEKRRPIEEVIDRVLFDGEVIEQSPSKPSETSDLEKKLQELTKAQRRQLVEIIAKKTD